MTDHDTLDDRLDAAFGAARTDPRWAGRDWTEPIGRVRRAARAGRAARVAGSVVAIAVVGAGAAGVHALTSHHDVARLVVGSQPSADPTPVHSGDGRAWLMSASEYATWSATNPQPSTRPDPGPSPVPLTESATRLRDQMLALLGPGASVVRADGADGGSAGHSTVWLRTAAGTPVAVERYQLSTPFGVGADTTTGSAPVVQGPASWPDGTAWATVTGGGGGYGFDAATQWSGPWAYTATGDGWFTMITAPVGTQQLLAWAQSLDADFGN